MGLDDTSPRTLRSKIARGAVLLSSGSLAVLLVGRSGQGCGEPAAEVPKPAAAPVAAPQPAAPAPAAEPAPVQPAQPANAPVAAPQPAAPQPAEPAPVINAAPGPLSPGPADSKNNAGPRYFPASKAGVFIEREPAPQQAPQQQAPQQQAGPR